MSLLPQINNEINSSVKTEVTLPSKTYRLKVDSTALQLQKGNKTTVSGSEIKLTDVKFTQENKTSIKVKGSTTQATRSGKNLYNKGNVSGTRMVEVPINELLAGTYTLSAVVTSSDTDRTQCLVLDATNNKTLGYLNRNVRSSFTFTLEKPTKKLNFYASTTYDLSNEDTFKFADIQIEQGTTATEYEQYGASPSPDYPSPIENVEGKNKFSGWVKGKRLDSTTGAEINSNTAATSDYIPVNFNNRAYTISGLTNTLFSYIAIYNSQKQFLGRTGASNYSNLTAYSNSFTSGTSQGTGDIAYVRVTTYENSGVTGKIDDIDNLETQLEEGTVATPYVPYNSLEIKDVGENLFDKKNNTILTWLTAAEITEEGSVCSKNFIPTTKNKIYATNFTACVFYYDKKLNYLGNSMDLRTDSGNPYTTWTNPDNNSIAFMKVEYRKSFNHNLDMTTQEIMLTESGIVKPYKPYQEQKIDFPLSEGQKLYEGSYLADDRIHNKRKQVILDGSERWVVDKELTNTIRFYSNEFLTKGKSVNALCNYFETVSRAYTINTVDKEALMVINTTQIAVRINKTRAKTVSEFKAYLSEQYSNGTPVIVEYELSEEEIVPYTTEQQKADNQLNNYELFDGVNYITMISTIPGTLSLAYYDKNNINLIKTEEDRIVGFVDNLEAVKQSIYHILSIERYAYLIYDDNYGVEFEQYIGKDFDYINATIENTLQEALLYDLRILNVSVDNIEQIDINKVAINFTVDTIYGNLVMEVSIDV